MSPYSLLAEVAELISALARTILLAILTCATGFATIAAYRLFLHPLTAIPGPRLAAVSSAWLALHARNGRVKQLGKELHDKYGPAVRVGPTEVWFNSEKAFRVIYSPTSGCPKSDFYLSTLLNKPRIDWLLRPHYQDTLDLLSERDMKRYRLQRRLLGPVYRASSVIKYEPVVDEVLKQAITCLKQLRGREVDLKEWMHILAVECLGAVVLSWSPGLLKSGTDGGTGSHSYQAWRRKTVYGLFPSMAKVSFCSAFLGRWFAVLWGITFDAPKGFRPFFTDVHKRVSRRVKAALRPSPPKDNRQDLMADLIQLHMDKPEFNETYLRRMAITNFGAGHETMAATLTSVVAMIASHKQVHMRVTSEVRSTAKPSGYTTAIGLAYTQAAIKEAKRLHPVIGMSLPRTVPAGGLTLHGVYLPAGMTVGCQPAALHRNAKICAGGTNPDEYVPERWLEGGGDGEVSNKDIRRMEQCSLSWGGGARTCPGRHLADLVVYKVITALFEEFDIEVTIPPEREMPSYFLCMMTGVKARFIPHEPQEV